MATFKGIKGVKVVTKATDPTASEATGTVWYNSTSPSALKYAIEGAGAWASSSAMNTARAQLGAAGKGSSTAGLVFGGAPYTAATEKYDGTSWTTVNNMLETNAGAGSCGTQTAALAAGGYDGTSYTTKAQSYDGTSWSEEAAITTARTLGPGGLGTSIAALEVGGASPGNVYDLVEKYDGTSWTEVGDIPTPTSSLAAVGTTTAALAMGGGPGYKTNTTSYDGTSWTAVNGLTTGRRNNCGFGSQTAALTMAGDTGSYSALTEKWDGTSWTEVGDLGTARTSSASGGSSSDGLIAGGSAPGTSGITEEWADPAYAIKTVTVS